MDQGVTRDQPPPVFMAQQQSSIPVCPPFNLGLNIAQLDHPLAPAMMRVGADGVAIAFLYHPPGQRALFLIVVVDQRSPVDLKIAAQGPPSLQRREILLHALIPFRMRDDHLIARIQHLL